MQPRLLLKNSNTIYTLNPKPISHLELFSPPTIIMQCAVGINSSISWLASFPYWNFIDPNIHISFTNRNGHSTNRMDTILKHYMVGDIGKWEFQFNILPKTNSRSWVWPSNDFIFTALHFVCQWFSILCNRPQNNILCMEYGVCFIFHCHTHMVFHKTKRTLKSEKYLTYKLILIFNNHSIDQDSSTLIAIIRGPLFNFIRCLEKKKYSFSW